jgi:transposase-like protein
VRVWLWKTWWILRSPTGKIVLVVPRDRQTTFDPQLIAKYHRRFPGFDDEIVSMYARQISHLLRLKVFGSIYRR